MKKSTLADLEAEVKVLTVRKNILEEQKETLSKTKEQLSQDLVRLCLEEHAAMNKPW